MEGESRGGPPAGGPPAREGRARWPVEARPGAPGPAPRLRRLARSVRAGRVLHPFPSLLDATVVAVIAGVAGAPVERVVTLAAAMLALQLAIGAANDWADAPADAVGKPSKPIAAGLVRRRTVAGAAIVLAGAGLALAALAGLIALVVAVAGLATGLAYDLRLKDTRWSWLPYAIGIPLLPVFAWVGATGSLPAVFAVLVPVAAVAGAALAIGNALADLERDEAAGVETVATALGHRGARRVAAVLMAVAAGAAIASALALGGAAGWVLVTSGGAAIAAAGIGVGWEGGPVTRRRAWEIQGVGAGVMAAGWIGALVTATPAAG